MQIPAFEFFVVVLQFFLHNLKYSIIASQKDGDRLHQTLCHFGDDGGLAVAEGETAFYRDARLGRKERVLVFEETGENDHLDGVLPAGEPDKRHVLAFFRHNFAHVFDETCGGDGDAFPLVRRDCADTWVLFHCLAAGVERVARDEHAEQFFFPQEFLAFFFPSPPPSGGGGGGGRRARGGE